MFIGGIIVLSVFGAAFLTGVAFLIVAGTQKKYSEKTNGKIIDKTIHNEDFEKGVVKISQADEPEVYRRTGGATSGGEHSYYLVYEYVVNGNPYRKTTGYAVGGLQANRKLGKEVTVYYNPSCPEQASIVKKGLYNTLSTLLLNIGGVGCVVGVILMLLANV